MAHADKPIACYVTDRKSLDSPANTDSAANLLEKIREALNAGADWVQIREKDLPGGRLLALARDSVAAANQVAKMSSGDAARVYVNDRLDVALAAGAAGVHLGGESLPVADVVRWCRAGNAPVDFQIGVSCHSVQAAVAAQQDGANYIFFGPVFDTPSKRTFGAPQGLDLLREVCRAVRIPVIAIGGVDETNAEQCIRSGAYGVAAIRLFQGTPKPEGLGKFISTLRATSRTP